MKPTITVVIPNYNDSVLIKYCIDSIYSQEEIPEKVIIVDDASTDNSLDVIRELIKEYENAELICNEIQLGTMGSLNVGLNRTTTDYTLFLSANDYLKPGIFKHAKLCLDKHNHPGVWSALVSTINDKDQLKYNYPSPVISLKDKYLSPEKCRKLSMLIGHWFTGTTLFFHTETLKTIGGFDANYKGLADMFAALSLAALKGASFTPRPYGVMRLHDDGLMTKTSVDLNGLDKIIEHMIIEGPKVCSDLFNEKFCDVMQRRIRFTAIRTFSDESWHQHVIKWNGLRYMLLNKTFPITGNFRRLQLIMAFIILRPTLDIITIVWYRLFGYIYISLRK